MKSFKIYLFVITFFSILFSCQKSEEKIDEGVSDADIFVSSIQVIEKPHVSLKNWSESSNNRIVSNKVEYSEVVYKLKTGESINAQVSKSLNTKGEEIGALSFGDDQGIAYSFEIKKNENGLIETHYYDLNESLLFTTSSSDGNLFEVSFPEGSNNRMNSCFGGCLKALYSDTDVMIFVLAGTIGGYGAYIAAGAAIGCGYHCY